MSKTAKIILFSIIGVVLLCCGGGGAAFYFILSSSLEGPRTATDDFFTNLETGRVDDAQLMLCTSTQTNFGPETFAEYVKEHPVQKHDLAWGGSVSTSGGDSGDALISVTIYGDNGAKASHSIPLLKENGNWMICGNPY